MPSATMKSHTLTSAQYGSPSPSSTRTSSDAVVVTPEESEAARLYDYHLSLLTSTASQHELVEVSTTPLFTMPVLEQAEAEAIASQEPLAIFPQYGLLAGMIDAEQENAKCKSQGLASDRDPRIFFNIAAPSSTFICGSQGSGKSHTLSCLLENCLIPSDASKLPRPLTGLVFHYDTFISDVGGSPCEAAFLSSNPKIQVRVLCSPTNIRTIQVCSILHRSFPSSLTPI
jgi:hypothetical protein